MHTLATPPYEADKGAPSLAARHNLPSGGRPSTRFHCPLAAPWLCLGICCTHRRQNRRLLDTLVRFTSNCAELSIQWSHSDLLTLKESQPFSETETSCSYHLIKSRKLQTFFKTLQIHCWLDCSRYATKLSVCRRADKFQAIAWDKVQMNNYNLKDNVALIVVLRLLGPPNALNFGTSPAIAIANTHLIFNPKRGDIKVSFFPKKLENCTESPSAVLYPRASCYHSMK